ncbi:MAG: metallophosphoesterase [Labilithrix sp.]|nr:metallophosphoesterase [Labilithrix sp.]
MEPRLPESLLVFSDVHLGSDIQEGVENGARRSEAVDRDLVRLLTHYRAQKPEAGRWRIVIAGDFIDFIGMTIEAAETLVTPLTAEEVAHGLGNACDHARLKLSRVVARHGDVFTALASFVADGNALTIVHGNHDIELHWDEVKEDLRLALLERALSERGDLDRAAFLDRIEYSPWFFYRAGVAYIEHGHQYDPLCATEHIMAPLSPLDPRRVARGFCDTLLRYVVRRTRGLKEHGHEHVGLAHYIRFGARLGLSGMFGLGARFARAAFELFRLRRAHFSEAAVILRAEHDERVAKLAEATRIGVDRLRALLSLQSPPVTMSIRGIMAGVLLDRLALALVATVLLVALAVYGAFHGYAFWGVGVVLVTWSLLHRWLSRRRTVDPAEALIERAGHLARLFPAAFVVMGHTHVPLTLPAGAATYVNVGSWAEDAAGDDGEEPTAPRTHLVIHVNGDQAEARFCAWADTGPRVIAGLDRAPVVVDV